MDNILPKIFKLGATQVSSPLEVQPLTQKSAYYSVQLALNKDLKGSFFWTFTVVPDVNSTTTTTESVEVLVFNEEVIGTLFGSSFQFSVVGLYATIVVAIGRFLRIIFDRISQRVIYEEMCEIEQLFDICEGIFIAQLEGDLVREKKLYDLLIRIYRSPETLIKLTGARIKHERMGNSDKQS